MDKTAVVTGGAGGIGKCLVESLAVAGMAVAFIDVDKPRLEETEMQMKARGFDVAGFHGDVADEASLAAFAAFTLARHPGGIDLLVNNACISRRGLLSGCSGDDFNTVLRVGVTAPYLLARLFLEHFRNGASIVNIASSRAFMSQRDTESYTAAKGGIVALTHAAGPSVEILGRLPDEAVLDLYRNCRLLVFPGEEDYGIVPLEAQACGRPVVAYAKGGALETVADGVSGVFFSEQTPESLEDAVVRCAEAKFDPAAVRDNALRFGPGQFFEGLASCVEKALA